MNAQEYLKGTMERYLGELSARSITPGGGSAAALTAALGAALNLMVINYSIKDGEEVPEVLQAARERQQESLEHLSGLIDEDCRVFRKLMDTLSKKQDAQKEYIAAATVPMKICREAHISMDITDHLIDNANRKLISDVGCAAQILNSAFYAAQLNVRINLGQVKDASFVKNADKALKTMYKDMEDADIRIINRVNNIINSEVAHG